MMKMTDLLILLFVSLAWAGEDICSNITPIQRVPSSACGRWYLIAAKKSKMMDKTNSQQNVETCGGFYNSVPCACSGFDISSAKPEPFIPEYNATGFSFNRESKKYDFQNYSMKIVDDKSNLALFNIAPDGGTDMNVIRGLATDDHQSFMLLYVCNQAGKEMDIWFLSKTPTASDDNLIEVNRVLKSKELSISEMFMVNQDRCIYPSIPETQPTSTVTTVHNSNNQIYVAK